MTLPANVLRGAVPSIPTFEITGLVGSGPNRFATFDGGFNVGSPDGDVGLALVSIAISGFVWANGDFQRMFYFNGGSNQSHVPVVNTSTDPALAGVTSITITQYTAVAGVGDLTTLV